MKAFQRVRKNLASIGIMPNQFHYRHYPFSRQSLIANLISIVGFISTTVFTFSVAESTKEYMDSLYVLIMACSIYFSYTTTIINMNKWFDYFENYDKFIDELLESDANDIRRLQMDAAKLTKTIKLIELLSKVIYFVIVIVGVPVFIIPKTVASFYNYLVIGLEEDAFELSLPVWIPFNWKNPFGYSCAVIYQSIMASFLLHYIACSISFAFGAYLFVTLINAHLMGVLKSINKMAKRKKSKSDRIFNQLSGFIHMHAEIKQICNNFSELYESTLTILFLGSTIDFTVTMLMIEISRVDFLMLWKSIFYGVGVLGLVFFSCELGQRFSNSFDEINENIMGKFNWYLLPIEIQRLLPLIIMNAQQPVVIKCFGNVLCGREQFKKVCDASYQYFAVLRKFYK